MLLHRESFFLIFILGGFCLVCPEELRQPAPDVEGHPTSPLVEGKNEEELKFEVFKNSDYYLPPFEDGLKSVPAGHLEFMNRVAANDIALYLEILREAIEKRNNFAPSVSLTWKYIGKLLSNFIHNRQMEQEISPRKEISPAFFTMLADLIEKTLDRSGDIKKAKEYTKKSVDGTELYNRTKDVFSYIMKVVEASPVSAYLKWNKLTLYKKEAPKDLLDETSDLLAMFRGMGYEKCMFAARRIVNLLRFFSKGQIPSEKDV